jgi:hypothetical protein
MRIEYHRVLLADRVRNAALHAALRHAIVKGRTTVADIGAGTGSWVSWQPSSAHSGSIRGGEMPPCSQAAAAHRLNCRIAEMHSTEVAELIAST